VAFFKSNSLAKIISLRNSGSKKWQECVCEVHSLYCYIAPKLTNTHKTLAIPMTVLVIAMLLLVAEGTRVVQSGWRRLVDGRYLRYALARGQDFLVRLDLLGGVDPDPSRKKKSWVDPVLGLKCQTMVFSVP
jgi:hypothetical protein